MVYIHAFIKLFNHNSLHCQALFLVTNDLLTISMCDESNELLSLEALYNIFYSKNNNFPIVFKVYAFFKAQGYIFLIVIIVIYDLLYSTNI